MEYQKILILDFGTQYNQLIARRVREHHVYCEVHPGTMPLDQIKAFAPIGIILSGGPYLREQWNMNRALGIRRRNRLKQKSSTEYRPLIGVTPLIDYEMESLWMLPGYMEGLQQAGALPIILPLTSDVAETQALAELCDGFLFTGGQDVEPSLYEEERLPACGECSRERDSMELSLLSETMLRHKPIMGICRGLQFINVALGGTLWQDLLTQKPSDVIHMQKPPYNQPAHDVQIGENTPLYDLLRKKRLSVNSCHHQGIRSLSPRLRCMATADDGLIEAVFSPEYEFLWAVQWHPEYSFETDESSRTLFSYFVRACGQL